MAIQIPILIGLALLAWACEEPEKDGKIPYEDGDVEGVVHGTDGDKDSVEDSDDPGEPGGDHYDDLFANEESSAKQKDHLLAEIGNMVRSFWRDDS